MAPKWRTHPHTQPGRLERAIAGDDRRAARSSSSRDKVRLRGDGEGGLPLRDRGCGPSLPGWGGRYRFLVAVRERSTEEEKAASPDSRRKGEGAACACSNAVLL
eukprot:CAMPEP_0194346190 /NCGR_PEP_ID=MMETSP0171-20130528/105282_1 /TAXON_ID=218684 /ORGANISM="Corethron pennatum, Strain L29A3" /LENGTH=103 /DNA_ID=CAMNT_0039113283 /DNA_START=2097 /DNA_END=2408 /DNA_ORIENTATION=+